jgi:hypothetical protein
MSYKMELANKTKYAVKLLSVSFPVLLCACNGRSDSFTLDNPTTKPVQVQIDDKSYTVPPYDFVALSLPAGQHSISSERIGKVKFALCPSKNTVVINPTLSDYVVVSAYYVKEGTNFTDDEKNLSTVTLDGENWRGHYQQIHDLFIFPSWHFDAHTPFPESYRSDSKVDIKVKLFTANDFIHYVEQATQTGGEFTKAHPQGYVAPASYRVETDKPLMQLAPEYQSAAKALYDLYPKRWAVKSSDECEALQKASFEEYRKFDTQTYKFKYASQQDVKDVLDFSSQVRSHDFKDVVIVP